ncbi:MAG: SurA N-terminal domain-containing protein [Deltaproteobacteria bacterium]|nr:SurA N-terminal domain-containing protein [Deltaproteobacteria bacterium]
MKMNRRYSTTRRITLHTALLTVMIGVWAAAGGCMESSRRTLGQDTLSRALAVVNNEPISYDSFMTGYQLFLTQWDRFIGNDQARKDEIKELLLQQAIDDKLMDQEARRRGIQVDDNELNAKVMQLVSGIVNNDREGPRSGLSDSALSAWAKSLQRRLIHQKLIEQEVISRIRVPAPEMFRYYQRFQNTFTQPERVNVRHIAVGSRTLYNRVMAELANRSNFVDLVRKYSITPDRLSDGELGFVERGVLPPEFDAAIFPMRKVGSLSSPETPVQTQMGFHIFRLEGYQPAGTLAYRDAIPEIRRRLLEEKQSAAFKEWLKELRNSATITIDHQLLAAE